MKEINNIIIEAKRILTGLEEILKPYFEMVADENATEKNIEKTFKKCIRKELKKIEKLMEKAGETVSEEIYNILDEQVENINIDFIENEDQLKENLINLISELEKIEG